MSTFHRLFVIFLTVTICFGTKAAEIYKDCGSQTASIVDVKITNCDKAPCIFTRGNNYTMSLEFLSKTDTKTAINKVYGVIAKIPIPFPLPNDNACTMGFNCPVKNGDSLTESVTLPILNEYPRISLFVQWKVIDDANKQMICFLFPVSIQ